jgi:hypothetical protein
MGLSNGDVFSRVREENGRGWNKWRAREAPQQALARPGWQPRHHMVWLACGSPWAAQVPPYMRKKFVDIFWIFSRNFIQNLNNLKFTNWILPSSHHVIFWRL